MAKVRVTKTPEAQFGMGIPTGPGSTMGNLLRGAGEALNLPQRAMMRFFTGRNELPSDFLERNQYLQQGPIPAPMFNAAMDFMVDPLNASGAMIAPLGAMDEFAKMVPRKPASWGRMQKAAKVAAKADKAALVPNVVEAVSEGSKKKKLGGSLTPSKAMEILHDGTVHGKPITEKQRKFFGARATEKMPYGGKLSDDRRAIQDLVRIESKKAGVDPEIMERVVYTESGFNPKVRPSPTGALGHMQIQPKTAKAYGFDPARLTSNKPEDKYAATQLGIKIFQDNLKRYNNDTTLALAAYNGGPEAVEHVKRATGLQNLTGEEWKEWMKNEREVHPSDDPSKWRNETYNYATNITELSDEDFYGKGTRVKREKGAADVFREKHYDRPKEEATDIQSIPIKPKPIDVPITPKEFQPIPVPKVPGVTDITPPVKKKTSLADINKPRLTDFIGELMALTDQPDFVAKFSYQPELFQKYQISAQDKLNQNNSSFKAIAQQLTNNPEALATLAGQKYEADTQVLGEQFRTNQAIANDIYNKNVGIMNDANMKNLQLADQQYLRQAQAIANTDARRQQAVTSIGNKLAQKRSENLNIRMMENLSDFRANKNMEVGYQGEGPSFNIGGGEYVNPTTRRVVTRKSDGTVTEREMTASDLDKAQQEQKIQEGLRKASPITKQKFGGLMKKMRKY